MDFTGIILILIIVGGVWALAEWRFASKHEHKKYWYRPTEEWMFGEMLDIDEAVERLWKQTENIRKMRKDIDEINNNWRENICKDCLNAGFCSIQEVLTSGINCACKRVANNSQPAGRM